MNTFLFSWNPVKWKWPSFEESIGKVKRHQIATKNWRVISHKMIREGDRAFLVKVGGVPRGIIGSGRVITPPFPAQHSNHEGKEIYIVTMEFDHLLNPAEEPILTTDILQIGRLAAQNWTPQASGIPIRPELVDELELLWEDFLNNR